MNKLEQEQAQAFHKGVEAMAKHLADQFGKYSGRDSRGDYIQRFGGPEIADIIRRCQRPAVSGITGPTA